MKHYKWINTVAFALTVLVNGLANLLPLGGNTTGEVSEAYPNLFTPAPITFAIWGVIYLFLAAFVVYGWGVPRSNGGNDAFVVQIGPRFARSCLWNILWIFCWHFHAIGLSLLCIVLLLLSLIRIEELIAAVPSAPFSRLTVNASFDLYLGWIAAATFSNVSVYLTALGWNGFGLPDSFWTVVVLLALVALALTFVFAGKKRIPALVLAWAAFGVFLRHLLPSGYAGNYPVILVTAVLGIFVILGAVLYSRKVQ